MFSYEEYLCSCFQFTEYKDLVFALLGQIYGISKLFSNLMLLGKTQPSNFVFPFDFPCGFYEYLGKA